MPLASALSASPRDNAEPPIISFQFDRSAEAAVSQSSNICKMVGTQCENVTLCSQISANILLGT